MSRVEVDITVCGKPCGQCGKPLWNLHSLQIRYIMPVHMVMNNGCKKETAPPRAGRRVTVCISALLSQPVRDHQRHLYSGRSCLSQAAGDAGAVAHGEHARQLGLQLGA